MTNQNTSWVALLRGVNVGGRNKVPMADLRALATGFGWGNVRSYISSGNLVFTATGPAQDLASRLASGMSDTMGVDVPVLVLSGDQIRASLASCPFSPEDRRTVHGFFCREEPVIDVACLTRFKTVREAVLTVGQTVWMFAPDGFGVSKLAAEMDRVITGTTFTARNLNTIVKLVDMAGDPG